MSYFYNISIIISLIFSVSTSLFVLQKYRKKQINNQKSRYLLMLLLGTNIVTYIAFVYIDFQSTTISSTILTIIGTIITPLYLLFSLYTILFLSKPYFQKQLEIYNN